MAILTGTDCAVSRLGTGMENCQPIEGLPNGFIAVPKGWSLNKTSGTFDLAYVQDQIQQGIFVPFIGTFETVSETPEATTEESQSGIMSTVRQGKPMYTCTFKKGLAFHAAAFSYNSVNQYDFLITYETGMIKCAESVDGTTIKGFDGGMLNTNGYQENNGTNTASTVLKFQLVDPLEYNQYAVLLTPENIGFNPNTEISGIIDVVITGRADVSDNKIWIKPVWKFNNFFSITGLAAANLRLTIDGVDDPIVGAIVYDAGTKEYEITPTATLTTLNAVVVSLYDSVNVVAVAQVGNKFYRGATAAITPVA